MNIKTKITSIILTGLCCTCYINGQNATGITHSGRSTEQAPFPMTTYVELTNPAPTDEASWKGLSGAQCSWGNTHTRYKKEVNPRLNKKNINVTGWKGERVAAQLVISSPVDLENVSVEVGPLTHSSGKDKIASDNMLKGFVRYVMTDGLNKEGQGTCGHRPDLSKYDSTLVADPIDHLATALPMKAKTSQGYWIRTWIPENALPGNYSSDVVVKNGQDVIGKLKLNVQVQNRTLPQPEQWAFHLDLWQNPFAIARYYQVPLWSEEHFKALKTELQPYADAGGKVITVSIMHHPWGGQTYDPFETMVTWVKRVDGTWLFDYTIFDKWIELMMDLGVTKEIGCYSMIPWKLSFQYFDQATNMLKELKAKPGDKAYHDLWVTMLKDFAAHLKSKGWFDITHVAMDERPMKDMMEAFKIIREADPNYKVSLAGSLHEELSDDLNDYCVAIGMKYTEEMKKKRKDEGKITTYYTCCSESQPNTYTFSDPAEASWLAWYAAKENLDGYLRWALNSWTLEPLLDSRFYSWGGGDTYMLYPGGRTCLRFENLVDGIQAYEKIRILKTELQAKGKTSTLKKLDKILKSFDEVQLMKTPASVVVERANKFINSL